MNTRVDLSLDGLTAADYASEHTHASMWPDDLTLLAEHHNSPNPSHSYLIAYDTSVTWGTPGDPAILAITIHRDLEQRLYTVETAHHATVPFAQNWLVERGCPPEVLAQQRPGFPPADDLTTRIERQILQASTRYEVLGTWSNDYKPAEAWTIVRDHQATQLPIRVFLEEASLLHENYTVREGAFANEGAARGWLANRDSPLPEPPEYHGDAATARAHAALTRSTAPPIHPATAPATHAAPTASPAHRPTPGRAI